MIYLTKAQIESLVKKIGQPKASAMLKRYFDSYRNYLSSGDVAELYDDHYWLKIDSHPIYLIVEGKYKINIYNRYSYEYLISRLTKDDKLLDIGCGTGDFALAIASQGIKAVIGIDSSQRAIQKAKAKLLNTNLNCEFICADVSSLNIQTLFDYVVLNDLVEHLSDGEMKQMFNKINNILKRDSEVVIHTPNGLSLCNDTDSNLLKKFYKIYLRIFKKFGGFERTVEQLYYDQVHINIKSYRQLRRFLKALGYKTKVIYDEKSNLPFLNKLSSNMLVIARKY